MKAVTTAVEKDGLRVVACPGENKILLAMSLADDAVNANTKNLAGFAIWRKYQNDAEQPLSNRISFQSGVTKDTTPAQRKWTPTDQAPIQKFRWIDVPPAGFATPITYRVRAMYFGAKAYDLVAGPEVSLQVAPAAPYNTHFTPAFTRGYIASQAYADKFKNADIRPKGPKTPDFDTKPYLAQYDWLGAGARRALFDFIADCQRDVRSKVDVFAYDLDEPDVISAICGFGKQKRLRAILDNADLHSKVVKGVAPPEIKAAQMIIAAAGAANVKQGHFGRFQHNKVFLKRDATGTPQRVFFGSMNFSVRGIYVQANNVIVVDVPGIAGMFGRAFDAAFAGNVATAPMWANAVSAGYMVGSATDTPELPQCSIALSPHKDWSVSLGPMADRIRSAKSSVLFAVMAPEGGGPVLDSLRAIAAKPTVFSYGTVETDKGLAVQNPSGAMGALTSFAFLAGKVPAPFTAEFSGGAGMHIHDKFVVVDFNDADPTVFAGSSNLASGGETENGDSLAMIHDQAIASMYAIEAVALFDHYQFRKSMKAAKVTAPFTLWSPWKPNAGAPWWQAYWDKTDIKMRDRYLFADLPLPAGMATTKQVDWKAVDAEAAQAAKKSKPAGKGKVAGSKKKAPAAKKPAAKRIRRAKVR